METKRQSAGTGLSTPGGMEEFAAFVFDLLSLDTGRFGVDHAAKGQP